MRWMLLLTLTLVGCWREPPAPPPSPPKQAAPEMVTARARFIEAMKVCDKMRGAEAQSCVDRAVDALDAAR